MESVSNRMEELGIVPVVVIDDPKQSLPLGEALLEGGLPCAEVTFRTDAAAEAIRLLERHFEGMLLGAGTVLTIEDARKAVDSGTKFIVSPGFDPQIVEWCLDQDILICPGVAMPTDITSALNMGLRILKFFPASVLGGVKALKSISGPFGNIRFIPSGGVNQDNMLDYLQLRSVLAVSGTWMVKRTLIQSGEFEEITNRTRKAVDLVKEVRQ